MKLKRLYDNSFAAHVSEAGTAVLVGGTVTVSNPSILPTTIVILSRQASGGTTGQLSVGTRVAGTSFVINSSSGTDTSTIGYFLIEPA